MKKLVLIKINQEESSMLVEMYPELEEYLDDQGKLTAECLDQGKLTAECLKALYGLIESGKLWFDTIKAQLLENGTEQDWSKLERLLCYVNATKDIPLTREMDDGPLQIVANINSSHASHEDYRGNT
eukprot:gene62019-biopygen38927